VGEDEEGASFAGGEFDQASVTMMSVGLRGWACNTGRRTQTWTLLGSLSAGRLEVFLVEGGRKVGVGVGGRMDVGGRDSRVEMIQRSVVKSCNASTAVDCPGSSRWAAVSIVQMQAINSHGLSILDMGGLRCALLAAGQSQSQSQSSSSPVPRCDSDARHITRCVVATANEWSWALTGLRATVPHVQHCSSPAPAVIASKRKRQTVIARPCSGPSIHPIHPTAQDASASASLIPRASLHPGQARRDWRRESARG